MKLHPYWKGDPKKKKIEIKPVLKEGKHPGLWVGKVTVQTDKGANA